MLREEEDTDDEFEEKDDDFEMNTWSMKAQPETGTLWWFDIIWSWSYFLFTVSQPSFPSQCPPGDDGLSKAEKAQADKEQAWAKTLKSVSWPEMDDDAVPSSYVGKVLACLGKWQLKVGQLQAYLEEFDKADSCISGLLGYTFTHGDPL